MYHDIDVHVHVCVHGILNKLTDLILNFLYIS